MVKKTKFENWIFIVEPTIRKPDHSITRLKKCPENDHSKTGRSGFRMLTIEGEGSDSLKTALDTREKPGYSRCFVKLANF